jgi:hypothetical protein
MGLVDFSRLAREFAARLNKIRQKHGIFSSIETLDAFRYGKINPPHPLSGWLIFPGLHVNLPPDSIRSCKNTAFSPQSKRLKRSATEKSTRPIRV